ncbi:hypothetical protein BVRB_6g139470 [Beta vulgaris subsp. vulgaris]|nr:hypothetical protein BVRB_6g139470 [Beta vulgaris subsp. vulgaris]
MRKTNADSITESKKRNNSKHLIEQGDRSKRQVLFIRNI